MRHARNQCRLSAAVESYIFAREKVIQAGFWDEIEWMQDLQFDSVLESDIMREGAWVILSAGMRESVIRSKFVDIANAFLEWRSSESIIREARHCRRDALKVFGHEGKVDAIFAIVRYLNKHGVDEFKNRLKTEGPDFLLEFPYLGPATSRHLAKNLGLGFAKPDRHLLRITAACGLANVDMLCSEVSLWVGDSPAVVDLVFWRFATLHSNYADVFNYCESKLA